MNAPAKPRRAFVLALLAACGAGASASTDSATTRRHQPLDTLHDARRDAQHDAQHDAQALKDAQPPEVSAAPAPGACVSRASRTFVAFSEGMSLADFDLAAAASTAVLALVETELCVDPNALEPSGALAADLAAHRLLLFEVVFVRDDASAADVGLRRVGAEDAGLRGHYRVATELEGDSWRIVSVTRP